MDAILEFLRSQLNNHLRMRFGSDGDDFAVFLSGGNWDPVVFDDNKLSLMLVNIEEEKVMGPANRYQKTGANGRAIKVHPEIRLFLYLLVVAQYNDYLEALKQLTAVIRFFQSNPTFVPQTHPDLPPEAGQLVLELNTLSFSEQNELWSSLKAACRPYVLYRAKLLLIESEDPTITGDIEETIIRYSGV